MRLAFGESCSPAPTSENPVRRSTSVTGNPARESASAAARPPMPAPTTATDGGVISARGPVWAAAMSSAPPVQRHSGGSDCWGGVVRLAR